MTTRGKLTCPECWALVPAQLRSAVVTAWKQRQTAWESYRRGRESDQRYLKLAAEHRVLRDQALIAASKAFRGVA